jgi:hypothetical protein
MKQPAVTVPPDWRPVLGRAFRDKLLEIGAEVLCVSLGSTHAHVLAKMPPGEVPRQWMGRAKVAANFKGKDQGWSGKMWAVRSKVIPIADREHQLNTFGYVLRHIEEGTGVWDFRDGADHPGKIPLPVQ